MKRFTISIPDKVKEKLDMMPEVNWPMVAKGAIEEQLEKMKKFEELEKRGDL